MPEMISVGDKIIPPNSQASLQSLSGLLGLQQQRQALQTGQYTQASALATSQQDQQKNQELQAAQRLVFEGTKSGRYTLPNGQLDRQKMADDISAVAPTYGQPVSGPLLSQANEIVQNQSAHQALSAAQQKQMGDSFIGLAGKEDISNSDIIDAVGNLRSNNHDPQFNRMLDSMLTHLPQNAQPQQLQKLMASWGASSTGQSQVEAGTINTGGHIIPTTANKFIGSTQIGGTSGEGVATTLSPQVIEQPITKAPAVVGGAAGTTPRPIGGGGKGQSTPWQPYPGQETDVRNFQQEVQGTRAAADQAPTAHNINQQILRLADNAKTGPGTDIWQHAVGALSAPFGLSPTANYQELGKFLEKNAINNMQSMGGPPSDARLSAAAAANGSTTFSPEALKAVTKFNDATNSALMQYRQGIDHAVGMGQNVDYTKLPAFKSAWAKNFDVDIYRVENAVKSNDTAELQKIAQELGPQGLRALAQKRQNLQALAQGQIPQ